MPQGNRDAHFTTKGFETVRIAAADVLREPDQVAASIAATGAARR